MKTRNLDVLAVLSTGRPISAADLAARVGTSTRSVRRDIAQLREQGYRIDSAPGVGGGYAAPDGAVLPPLQFSSAEVFTLVLALRTLAGQGLREASVGTGRTGSAGPPAPVDTAVRKLRSILPPTTAHVLDHAADSIVAAAGNEPEVPVDVLAAGASAIAQKVLVDLRHRSRDRRVEPYRIVVLGAHWYLLAWDLDAGDWRTFRLDRIERLHQTTFRFRPRPHPEPVEFVRAQVTQAVYDCVARVRVRAPAAEVSAAVPARAGSVKPLGDAACELVIGASSPRWLALYLLSLPYPFTVIEPVDLVSELTHIRDRIDTVLTR